MAPKTEHCTVVSVRDQGLTSGFRPFLADTVGFSCHLAATLGLPFLVQKPGVLGQPSPQREGIPLLG